MGKVVSVKGRWISDKHIKAYKEGVFSNLFKAIKEDPELSLEIRMNDEAKVYYRKKKILTTSLSYSGKFKVTMLDKNYYKGKKAPSINIEDMHNLRSLTLIRKYFGEAKRLVYFYTVGEEFSFQQNIALGNHSFANRFLVVDMEWEFSQAGIKASDRIKITRPDLVIVDTEKNGNGFNDIYLAELKVGTGAKDGKSGIIDHVDKTFNIIQKPEACAALINDVKSIIANKIDLGIITGEPKEFHYDERPKMMLISAYRGEMERKELEKEAQKACAEAERIGMEKPVCILYNALIKL